MTPHKAVQRREVAHRLCASRMSSADRTAEIRPLSSDFDSVDDLAPARTGFRDAQRSRGSTTSSAAGLRVRITHSSGSQGLCRCRKVVGPRFTSFIVVFDLVACA
jgi:hypothetical protein